MTLSYKRDKIEGKFDAIVIGSGLGGLSTAAFLAKRGKKILVLERHYTAGGYTHVFKRRGYEWDVGVHYVGDVHHPKTMMNRIFNYICDKPIEWADMGEVYDKMFFGKKVYNYKKGKKAFAEQMKEYFPHEAEAIDQYIDLIYQAQASQRNYFAEKALPKPLKWVLSNRWRKKALKHNATTLEVLSSFIRDKKLIAVLCAQFGDYGLPPAESSFMMHATLAKHYMNGGYYPIGGSSVFFERIAPTITKNGGQIFTNAEVTEILIENKKAVGVKMADGQSIFAPLVISSTGVFNTYQHLLPSEFTPKDKGNSLLKQVKPSIAHVCLYVGFKHSTESLNLQKANYWIYPDHYDHDKSINDYLNDPDAEIPVVYVSFPSAKDPDWDNRYPGRASIDIITLASYDWYKKWEDTRWMKRGEDYDEFKEKLSQRLLEKLFEHEPQLRDKVDHYELGTPLSTKHFVNYQYGELYGLENSVERFNQTLLNPQTPVKNLYLTGQDIVTCGVGGALASGLITASAITKKNLMTELI